MIVMITAMGSIFMALSSCVPLEKNLALAESAIKQAKRVKAETYASGDFESALGHLKDAKKLKEERKKKPANAKAVSSIGFAEKAYHSSVVAFEKKQVELTSTEKEKAEKVKASILAADLYEKAVQTFEEAKKEMAVVHELTQKLTEMEKNEEK